MRVPFLMLMGVAALGLALPRAAGGAVAQNRPGLESYLKRLGYESVVLKRKDSNHLVVEGRIAGKSRVFLVDTGWSCTALSKNAAKNLKTLGELDQTLEDSFLGLLTDPELRLLHFEMGRASFTNQPALVHSLAIGGSSAQDGILGFDFLHRNHCLIDCLDRRLYVRGSALSAEGQRALEESMERLGCYPVKLTGTLSLAPTCEARANGKAVRLLIDTGGIWSILDDSQVKLLGLRPRETGVKVAGVGRIGERWLEVAQLKTLELGELVLTDIDFGVTDLGAWGIGERGRSVEDVAGILGAEQLTFNGALIDCRALKLWLQPLKRK